MNFIKTNDVKQNDLKLTKEEVKKVNGFDSIADEEADAIIDFIYNISIILFRTDNYGKS